MFTDDELRWLAMHRMSPDDVYDGRGQSQWARRAGAKAAGKKLILSSVRCRGAGHRLRTRSHHCVQCNIANLGFQERYNSPGYVYIAGSKSGRVIKLGTASDITQRENQLKKERHAGFADWEVLFFIEVNEAGRIEYDASRRVVGTRIYKEYFKDGMSQTAIEIIECSFAAALKAITEVVGRLDGYFRWQWTRAHEYDDFAVQSEEGDPLKRSLNVSGSE